MLQFFPFVCICVGRWVVSQEILNLPKFIAKSTVTQSNISHPLSLETTKMHSCWGGALCHTGVLSFKASLHHSREWFLQIQLPSGYGKAHPVSGSIWGRCRRVTLCWLSYRLTAKSAKKQQTDLWGCHWIPWRGVSIGILNSGVHKWILLFFFP